MILYIGNKLSKHGFTPTSVETLGAKLQTKYKVLLVSDKKNKVARLLNVLTTIARDRKKINVVLIDTYSTANYYYALLSALLCRALKIPYIPILHGAGLPQALKKSPYLSKQIFNHSAVNVSPSYFLANAFEQHGFDVQCIPNYIEAEDYTPKIRSSVRPRLLYVRSFHEIYNPSMAVEVLNVLSKEYEDATLCMVGPDKDGSQKTVESLAAEHGLADKLKITGKLSKEQWTTLAADYDIFINTTNVDNLPVSVIEALCLGLPVISTNVGGLPFLIDEGADGFLVNVNAVDEMVDQVKELVNNTELSTRISKSAIAKGRSFDWNEIEPIWSDLLDPLIKQERELA